MRKIAVIIGSKSDLSQCLAGLNLLQKAVEAKEAEIIGIYVRSQHRNTRDVQQLMDELIRQDVDVAIIGAGWANHLTGCCDAYENYVQRSIRMAIIGVAFEDEKNQRHTNAAVLSMTEVPGHQIIYSNDNGKFIGATGFRRACWTAVNCDLPERKLSDPKPPLDFSLEEAIVEASK